MKLSVPFQNFAPITKLKALPVSDRLLLHIAYPADCEPCSLLAVYSAVSEQPRLLASNAISFYAPKPSAVNTQMAMTQWLSLTSARLLGGAESKISHCHVPPPGAPFSLSFELLTTRGLRHVAGAPTEKSSGQCRTPRYGQCGDMGSLIASTAAAW